jgi:hypothetical protein
VKRALCNAAALAAVGWYVMIPPWKDSDPRTGLVVTNAPLSEWQMISSYDTADACAQGIEEVIELAKHNSVSAHNLASLAECIAADDPRLKGSHE